MICGRLGGVSFLEYVLMLALRKIARIYLVIFDLLMRLGPSAGPLVIVVGWLTANVGWLSAISMLGIWKVDPILDILLIAPMGLSVPLLSVAMNILMDNWKRSISGQWPESKDFRFLRWGEVGPTICWINKVRDWSKLRTL